MLSFVFILLAGLINSSYPIPLRFIKNANKNRIWCIYSFIGLAIIPWIIFLTLINTPLSIYLSLTSHTLIILLIGGVIFGVGQVCFASAIEKIGVALAFSITLSIGTSIGSLFTVFYQRTDFSTQSLAVSIAVLLIIVSLITYYFVGKASEQNHSSDTGKHKFDYQLGWLLVILTGISSGIQNVTFILALRSETALESINTFWVWPPFLLIASIPMIITFYFLSRRTAAASLPFKLHYVLSTILMGICFTGSLWLYSLGINSLSPTQQMIGWPLFMVAIILTCQFWGFIHHEFNLKKTRTKLQLLFSVVLLITAIIILAVEG